MKDTDINRALAKVMEYPLVGTPLEPSQSETWRQGEDGTWRPFDPLTNAADSEAVVDKMVADGWDWNAGCCDGLHWFHLYENKYLPKAVGYAEGPDRKCAIAEAVLRCMGLWVEEEVESDIRGV